MGEGAGAGAITLACEKPHVGRDCLDAVSWGEAGDVAAGEELVQLGDELDHEEAEERKVMLSDEGLIWVVVAVRG